MVRDKEESEVNESFTEGIETLVSGLIIVYFKESREKNLISGFHEDDFHFDIQD